MLVDNCEQVGGGHIQAVKIRSAQSQPSSQSCILPTAALTAPQLERLRHAFELLCEGSGREAGVKAHQLPEIMVMAGMDLSATDTRNALAELVRDWDSYQLMLRLAGGGFGAL